MRRPLVVVGTVLLLASPTSGADAGTGSALAGTRDGVRTVDFQGYRLSVPSRWAVVDLAVHPHACVRFDRPALYLGRPGDQSACPSHVVGGAPGLLVEPMDARSAMTPSTVSAAPDGAVGIRLLPGRGPVTVAVEAAGQLVTAVYGASSAPVVQRVLSGGRVLADARPATLGSSAMSSSAPEVGASVPGNYVGPGFDACTAPSQAAMDAWDASSAYDSVGVYIGGVSRGCAQPNLTAAWVSRQVANGWHLVPTYVGRQAPCTSFYNRMSYDPKTARAQGRAEAADAAAQADALGMAAPSTLYADVEGYNNTSSSCVAAVLSYASGWTHGLHRHGYEAGVYSSASSGIRDLSTSYRSPTYNRPDDIWLAWWNGAADVEGGSYVPDSQWASHQRVHQYVGDVPESHGGYPIAIDRDFLDVSTAVQRPQGCPTNVSFATYSKLRQGSSGAQVVAAQCQLARRGFDPGRASGRLGWRTAAAIRAFKSSRALLGNAVVNRRAWTALLSGGAAPFLETGSTGGGVRKLQRSLSASLERSVTVDGTFDRDTRRAVVQYQRAHALGVDGTAGRQTWRALQAGR